VILTILKVLNRFKFWILLAVFAGTIFLYQHHHRNEVIGLEGVISSAGVDIMTCKGNLALCETNFKELADKCRKACPAMSGDIDEIQRKYAKSKEELIAKQKEIDKLLGDINAIKKKKIEAGDVIWPESATDVVDQLKKALGKQWTGVMDKIKKDSGMGPIQEFAKRWNWYPKLKMGVGYDMNQAQAQVGVSLFSYGKIKAVDQTYLDFVEPYVAVGLNGANVAIGIAPVSLNLGGFLPVIKDLDITGGVQFNLDGMKVVPIVGVTSTF
jgi:hypothetical protein